MTSGDYLDNPAKIASYLGAFGSLALTTLDPTATTKTLTDTARTLDEVVTEKTTDVSGAMSSSCGGGDGGRGVWRG